MISGVVITHMNSQKCDGEVGSGTSKAPNAVIASMFRDGEATIKITFSLLRGGGGWGHRGKSSKNAVCRAKRHDDKILKVQMLLSRIFVFIAPAPTFISLA